jgi:hypothetical protein
MQPIDPNTLFSIFEQGDEEIYREHGVEEHLQNPFVLMGMVLRGIDNFHMMDMMYMRQYPSHYKKVRNITKYKYFNKLYSHLLKIDNNSFEDIYKIGESFDTKQTKNGLDILRVFYERLEEYEKCAVIKKYIDLLLSYGKQTMDVRL